jgi:hypothetical protein
MGKSFGSLGFLVGSNSASNNSSTYFEGSSKRFFSGSEVQISDKNGGGFQISILGGSIFSSGCGLGLGLGLFDGKISSHMFASTLCDGGIEGFLSLDFDKGDSLRSTLVSHQQIEAFDGAEFGEEFIDIIFCAIE